MKKPYRKCYGRSVWSSNYKMVTNNYEQQTLGTAKIIRPVLLSVNCFKFTLMNIFKKKLHITRNMQHLRNKRVHQNIRCPLKHMKLFL